MSEDESNKAQPSGFSVEYAEKDAETLSASDYKSRVKGIYPIKLPQSRAVFKAQLLPQELANLLTFELGGLGRTGTGGFTKKSFAKLSSIADEYLPKIIVEPKIVRPVAEGETVPEDSLITRDIVASDMIAILTWGSTGEIPDYEAMSAMSSFREE